MGKVLPKPRLLKSELSLLSSFVNNGTSEAFIWPCKSKMNTLHSHFVLWMHKWWLMTNTLRWTDVFFNKKAMFMYSVGVRRGGDDKNYLFCWQKDWPMQSLMALAAVWQGNEGHQERFVFALVLSLTEAEKLAGRLELKE